MADDGELIFVGAEAELRRGVYLGHPSVRKRRVAKAYRVAELDERIRRERTRAEALLLAEAGKASVPTPRILDVDLRNSVLEMEAVEGSTLRRVLERGDARGLDHCRAFGRIVGRLHAAGLVHGDLTTSNVMVRGDELVLLDFGLAQRSRELEDRGVDLHLVERTFEASHPERPELLRAFLEGYGGTLPEAEAVLRRMDEVKQRARYV